MIAGALIPQIHPRGCQCNRCKIAKDQAEAASGTTAVAQIRPGKPGHPEKHHKAVSKIHKGENPAKVKKESKTVRIGLRTGFKESDGITPTGDGNKFGVILIQEGLGNLKDCFYYTKECLQNSVSLFEGVKCFADHADQIEEQIHPERSTRDILGHFEDVSYIEEQGRGSLRGTLILCEGPHFDWARSLLTNALEYAHKYPNGDFVGLSINAAGEATSAPIQDYLRSSDVPDSVRPKLDEALAQGIDEIRPVGILKDATSCDLVTEAGAGGKILAMMERNKKPMSTKVKEAKEEKEKKEAGPGDGSGGDGGQPDHADADQDAELFKKMIHQYLGDDAGSVDQEEAMKMAKHAHEHFMKQGMEKHEAYEAAGHHMKNSAAIGKMMGAKPSEEEAGHHEEKEEESHEEAQTPPPAPKSDKKGAAPGPAQESAKMRDDLVKANAEVAKLRESVKELQVSTYLDKKLAGLASKRSPEFLGKLREAIGKPKSVTQIEETCALFVKAYDAGSADSEESDAILTEKTVRESGQGSGGKVIDFSDCA